MDTADIRLRNALLLRDHHVRRWQAQGDERARTPESSFAELVGMNPAHWSQVKSRHRHIGGKLARQIESHCRVPAGSLDSEDGRQMPVKVLPPEVPYDNDDERHAVQLFLTAYRMNRQAVKLRLLDVLQAELLKGEAVSAGRSQLLDSDPGFAPRKKLLRSA